MAHLETRLGTKLELTPVVLHVAPEAVAGGPLGLAQEGDMIELDVAARRLHLDVSEAELARRRTACTGSTK